MNEDSPEEETHAVAKRFHILHCCMVMAIIFGSLICATANPAQQVAQQLENDKLSVNVDEHAGTYQIAPKGGAAIFTSRVAAQVNHEWLRSSDYPRHHVSQSTFTDELGSGRTLTVSNSGLQGKADLIYAVQLYDRNHYGTVRVTVRNTTGKELSVQALRSVEAVGEPLLNLGGAASADRVLSDSFSEDWPRLRLYDLGNSPGGVHRGVGSQLIYNRESKQSLFLGALTADRLLTILHLKVAGEGTESKIASYSVDSTGTTEIQKDFGLKKVSAENQIELSLGVAPGEEIASERLMLQAGPDYHDQLLAYGDAIRRLHRARVSLETPIGWWSWTAFYGGINEGVTLANADWQSEHLKSLGYRYFQIDEGYQYARGEFVTANATQFPDGMRVVGHHITGDGLTFGVWTAPFEVTARAWVYEHHKEWLVHNSKGEPIPMYEVWDQKSDMLYTLDATHPEAQEYLRQTYRTLVREWGVRFIKLDFMDTTAIEGPRYRPNTTALEALRIGLQVIRDTVGDGVVLDKDGSPMLTPVGLVDTGRISADTAHSFQATRTSAPGVAARFYMHRNYFLSDPDAFNTTDQPFKEFKDAPNQLPLAAAQASIALSAVSGGMYEIGDDMLLLGSMKDRLALVENAELLNMAKIGRASTPIDLISYAAEDELPSIFFLRESGRQAILTIFNWTKSPRSHALKLSELGLDGDHSFTGFDVLNENAAVSVADGSVRIENQPAESVRVIKIIDSSSPASAPTVTASVPPAAKSGESFKVAAQADAAGAPAVGYAWNFGDGTSAEGPAASHTYTRAADFTIRLSVQGVDGVPSVQTFLVKCTGDLKPYPSLLDNRRHPD
jgi:alpha-galactosidase